MEKKLLAAADRKTFDEQIDKMAPPLIAALEARIGEPPKTEEAA